MSKVTKFTDKQGADALEYIGYNLLEGVEPKVVCRETGGHPEYKNWKTKYDPEAYKLVTAPYTGDLTEHIDIFSEDFTFVYDLGKSLQIDGLFTSGCWYGNGGMSMLAEYELYVSENEDDLFLEKNLVVNVDNRPIAVKSTPRQSDAYFKCEGVRGRYFGFKMIKACVSDEITRLSHLGVYNDKISEQKLFLDRVIEGNYLTAERITLPEGSCGKAENLTNGSVFNVDDAVVLGGDRVVLTAENSAEYLTVTGVFQGAELYSADSIEALWDNALKSELTAINTGDHKEICNLYKLTDAKKYIGLKLEKGDVLEQLGLYTYTREAKVDTTHVKTEDFIGIGANDIPMAWMPESRQKGFRNVLWPVYQYRFNKAKPSVVRVWFQPDWVVTEEEDYKQGKCNFQSDKMRAFLKYMDTYQAAGIEVELDFGWKVSTEIQEWYCVPTTGSGPRSWLTKAASAPKDFEGFAKCCASTIKFLAEEKGYTCLKYLSFYNESNYGDDHDFDGGDFLGYRGKSKEMWEKMLRAVDKELKAQNLDKYVQYWLAEESGCDEVVIGWIDYMMENCREFNSLNCFHRYANKYNDRIEMFREFLAHSGDVGAAATEFAVYSPPNWNQSNVEYVMSMLHSGLRGGLYWILQGVMLTDPTWLYLKGNERSSWFLPPYEEAWTEAYPYHEFSLFTHYLPAHSKVLETYSPDEDVRIETIVTPDGNYTVFVESKESKFEKTIEVKFSEVIGKAFRKHVYKESEVTLDGNLTIPRVLTEIEVGDTLSDTLDTDYQLVCYTTIPAFRQINLNSTYATAPLGGSFKFEAELIDCDGELLWEVVASDGDKGTIDQNGLFQFPTVTRPGDRHAIKVSLKDHPETYTVALIKAE